MADELSAGFTGDTRGTTNGRAESCKGRDGRRCA